MVRSTTNGGLDMVQIYPMVLGNEPSQVAAPAVVAIFGLCAGVPLIAAPGVVEVFGLSVGTVWVASPALIEVFGVFVGNLEIASPGGVEVYAAQGLNVYVASPALFADFEAIDTLTYSVINPAGMAVHGIDYKNAANVAPIGWFKSGLGGDSSA